MTEQKARDLTAEERAAIREQVARSRAAQGLPPHIQDEGFLRELAAAVVERKLRVRAVAQDEGGADPEAAE